MKTVKLYVLSFPNGKKYVGISHNPQARFTEHKRCARTGSDTLIYKAIRKYGTVSVTMEVIAEGPRDLISALEISLIAEMGTRSPGGYNLSLGGELTTLGLKLSEITRSRMSKAAHKTHSSEHIHNRATSRVANGKKWAEESRNKASASQKRRFEVTPADPNVMSKIAKLHDKTSPEYRLKCSESAKRRWARTRQALEGTL